MWFVILQRFTFPCFAILVVFFDFRVGLVVLCFGFFWFCVFSVFWFEFAMFCLVVSLFTIWLDLVDFLHLVFVVGFVCIVVCCSRYALCSVELPLCVVCCYINLSF